MTQSSGSSNNTPPNDSRKPDDPNPGGSTPQGSAKPAPSRGMFGIIILIAMAMMLFFLFSSPGKGQQITLNEFIAAYQSGEILEDSVVISESSVQAKRKAGPDSKKPTTVTVPFNAADSEYVAKEVYKVTGNKARSKPPSTWLPILLTFGPLVLIIFVIWFFIARGLRSAGGGPGGMLGNFGKSRHRTMTKEMTGITFKDVAGIDEAKEEVSEIIEFLRTPKRFAKIGGRIPRGVLLTGPPGCGKTLLARAIAGEADVPFFSISGSDFVEMFVGVGASRVRDLFKQAKETAPCIIFLDEIDAVGRRRGSGFSSGGHDEREQTLNAILVEMDGFSASDGVIVIAATNRADVLDPALIRPGRFDRQISVPPPDVKGRLEILRVHSKKVKMGPDVNLQLLARATPGFSGADLAAIINEAAIAATLADKDFIEQTDLEEARDKVKFGRAQKSRVREEEDNRLAAFHEAGHAVLQILLKDADPLHKVTILPRGDAGGATFSLPSKDRMAYGLKWLVATIRMACGGRIAEQRAMDDVSSGAAMDIAQVTQIARHMVLEWGMSDRLGFIRYAGSDTREVMLPEREYSEATAQLIDEEVRRIVDEAYADAKSILYENWESVDRVANALLKHETLSADEVAQLMRGETLDKPSVADLLTAEAKKTITPPAPEPTPDEEPGPDALPSPA